MAEASFWFMQRAQYIYKTDANGFLGSFVEDCDFIYR